MESIGVYRYNKHCFVEFRVGKVCAWGVYFVVYLLLSTMYFFPKVPVKVKKFEKIAQFNWMH